MQPLLRARVALKLHLSFVALLFDARFSMKPHDSIGLAANANALSIRSFRLSRHSSFSLYSLEIMNGTGKSSSKL